MSILQGVIGGLAGGASLIFGNQAAREQEKFLNQLKAEAQREYKALEDYGVKEGQSILSDFLGQRNKQIGDYSTQYDSLISGFEQKSQDIRSSYESGMNDVYNTAAVGRDKTIQALRQATERSVGRTTQIQALTGLGGSTFGQNQLAGIEQQGALQEGVVQEQYASQLAAIRQNQVQGSTQMSTNALGQSTGMRQGLQNTMLMQGSQLSGQEAAMRSEIMNQYMGLEQLRIGSVLGIEAGKQAFAGSGWAAASGMMSGIAGGMLGGMGSGMAGGMGGMFGGGGGADASLSAGELSARQQMRGF